MPKILNSKYENSLLYVVDCFIENDEYQPFKQQILEQMAKNVEVPGFRKGNAPVEKAVEHMDSSKMQVTILQELVDKYFPELEKQVQQELDQDNRQKLNATVSTDPEVTKETEEGFQFRVSMNLLPQVDLEEVKNITIQEPQPEELENRYSLEEFKEQQKNYVIQNLNEFETVDKAADKNSTVVVDLTEEIEGQEDSKRENKDITINLSGGQFPDEFTKELVGLKEGDSKAFQSTLPTKDGSTKTLNYQVECKAVKQPKYDKLEDILANVEEAKNKLGTQEDFEKLLENVYNEETQKLIRKERNNRAVKALVENVSDFPMAEQKIQGEIDRLYNLLDRQSKEQEKEITEAFKESGLPGSEEEVSSDEEVRKHITNYVRKEFKLVSILQFIYHRVIENKITDEEVEDLKKKIKEDPQQYNVSQSTTEDDDQLKDVAFDRLLRARAFEWVLNNITIQGLEEGEDSQDSSKETKENTTDSNSSEKKGNNSKTEATEKESK
jgi:trigger factor